MQEMTVDELRAAAFAAWQTYHIEKRDLGTYVQTARAMMTAGLALAEGVVGGAEEPDGYRAFVRNMTFNVASACWPGWEDAYDDIAEPYLEFAREMCAMNVQLSEQLDTPPGRLANGYWMTGAHQLAARDWDGARTSFKTAARLAEEADAKDSITMAGGWLLVTDILAGQDRQQELDALCEELSAMGEDGELYASQFAPALNRLGEK